MSKKKASLFAEGFKGASQRVDAAIVNFTKSMNDAAKALEKKEWRNGDDSTGLMNEKSPRGIISKISNRLHNLSCEFQGGELAGEFESMACEIWGVLKHISNKEIEMGMVYGNDAIEWKNGDEIEVFNEDSEWVEARYVAFDSGMGYHVVSSDDGLRYSVDSDVRELELGTDKAKRETLEIIDSGNFDVTHGEVMAILDELSSAGMLKSRGDK